VSNDAILEKYFLTFPDLRSSINYGFVVNYGLDGNKHRFFLIDVKNKSIEYQWFTSHGVGSGSYLRADTFSNKPGSLQSCLGRIKTAETYYSSKFGYALRLDGLDDTNNNIRKRAIVMHPATYVSERYIYLKHYAGRSEGCITLDPARSKDIVDKLKGGSYGLAINFKS
jgi:hypothetical protein